MRGKPAHLARSDTITVNQTRNLDTRITVDIVDQAGIEHIAVDLVHRIGRHRFHDVRSILERPLMADRTLVVNLLPLILPLGYLADAPSGILVEGNVESVDQRGIPLLDEERIVLCIMFAGLGAVIAQMLDVLIADHVIVFLGGILMRSPLSDLRVQVVAVPVMQAQQPCHVVYACNLLNPSFQFILHTQSLEQGFRTYLHTVAETDSLYSGVPQHVGGKHRHGIGVVQQQRIRAHPLHHPGKLLHHRDCSQRPHHPPDSDGIGNSLSQTVLLGNLKVNDGRRVVAANLNGIDHEGGTPQGGLKLSKPVIDHYSGSPFIDGIVDGLKNHLRLLQPLCIDIVERHLCIPQSFGSHAITQHIACKHCASSSQKGNFHRFPSPIMILTRGNLS